MENEIVKQSKDLAPNIIEMFHTAPLQKLIMVPVKILIEDDSNPFDVVDNDGMDLLKKSMTEDPDFMKDNHLVVNTYKGREGIVLMGNKRLRAAKELKWEQIPVTFCRIPKSKERARAIIANKHVGNWNQEKLQLQFMELRDDGYNMESLTFSPQSIVDSINLGGEVDNSGEESGHSTTPSKVKEVQCPECEHVFNAKDHLYKQSNTENQ